MAFRISAPVRSPSSTSAPPSADLCTPPSSSPTARAADLLFVKVIPGHTNDLKVHCDREKIPYLPFEQFLQVKETVANVIEGRETIEKLLQ